MNNSQGWLILLYCENHIMNRKHKRNRFKIGNLLHRFISKKNFEYSRAQVVVLCLSLSLSLLTMACGFKSSQKKKLFFMFGKWCHYVKTKWKGIFGAASNQSRVCMLFTLLQQFLYSFTFSFCVLFLYSNRINVGYFMFVYEIHYGV